MKLELKYPTKAALNFMFSLDYIGSCHTIADICVIAASFNCAIFIPVYHILCAALGIWWSKIRYCEQSREKNKKVRNYTTEWGGWNRCKPQNVSIKKIW